MKQHIHMTIEGARKNWKIFGMPKAKVLEELNQLEKKGWKIVPSEGCDNSDKLTGCKGHK